MLCGIGCPRTANENLLSRRVKATPEKEIDMSVEEILIAHELREAVADRWDIALSPKASLSLAKTEPILLDYIRQSVYMDKIKFRMLEMGRSKDCEDQLQPRPPINPNRVEYYLEDEMIPTITSHFHQTTLSHLEPSTRKAEDWEDVQVMRQSVRENATRAIEERRTYLDNNEMFGC
jgi:hypothetical protein